MIITTNANDKQDSEDLSYLIFNPINGIEYHITFNKPESYDNGKIWLEISSLYIKSPSRFIPDWQALDFMNQLSANNDHSTRFKQLISNMAKVMKVE